MADNGTEWLRKMIREEIMNAIKEETESTAELYDNDVLTREDVLHLQEVGFKRHVNVWYHPIHWRPFLPLTEWVNMSDEEIDMLPHPDVTINESEFNAITPGATMVARQLKTR
jgi:hypothetical protein